MTITNRSRARTSSRACTAGRHPGPRHRNVAASLLEDPVHIPSGMQAPAFDWERAPTAGERIRELRKGVTLGGITIRESIDEGRP